MDAIENGHNITPYEETKALLDRLNEGVQQATRRRLEGLEDAVELPQVEGEEPEDAAEDWLFDSRREYLEQLDYYKDR